MNNAASSDLDRTLRAKKGKADGVRPVRSRGTSKNPHSAPQAVVKVVSQARGFRVRNVLRYVARELKDKDIEQGKNLPLEDEYGRQLSGRDAIDRLHDDWSKDFERAKPGQKNPPRHVTHMILSADCQQNPANARAVLDAARDTLQSQLAADGYRFAFVLHTDTDKPHVHVIINNYHMDGGNKLRLNPPELHMLRQEFAEQMRARGLEQYATRKLDRIASIEQGMQSLREGGNWYEAKMFRAAGQESQNLANVEATDKMLKLAAKIEGETGDKLDGNDFQTVRSYLDRHSAKSGARLGLDAGMTADTGRKQELGAFDAFSKRKAMSKAVVRLRDEVKATTLPFSQERREKLAALADIRKTLINPAAPNYMALADALEKKLNKQVGQVQGYIRDLAEKEESNAQRERRSKGILRSIDRNLKTAEETRLQVLRSGFEMAPAERHALLQRLNDYTKQLKRMHKLHSLGLNDLAAPGTTAQIEAAAQVQRTSTNADKALERLEAAGTWHTPKNPRQAGYFDAFAKREGLAKAAARIEEGLTQPTPAQLDRLQAVREKQINSSAPNPDLHVAAVIEKARNAREAAIRSAREAVATRQDATARAQSTKQAKVTLQKATAMLHRARRDLASDSAIPAGNKANAVSQLKRIERAMSKAAKAPSNPLALAVMLRDLGPARDQDRATLLTTKERDFEHRRAGDIATARAKLRAASETLRAIERIDFSAERGARNIANRRTRQALAAYLRTAGQHRGIHAERPTADQRLAPSAVFAGHLDKLHKALSIAGDWSSDTPYNSPNAERLRTGIELDSFAKRAAMLRDVEQLRETLNAGRIDLNQNMRDRLKDVRAMGETIRTAPAKDLENAIARLAQKVTDDQLRLDGRARPGSAVELVQQRREAQRIADRNLSSIEAARAEVRKHPTATPQQRQASEKRLQQMSQAMGRYSGRGKEL